MKRLLAIVLLLLLVIPMTALAYTPFTLRNGYYWGMPKEEIFALAQQEGLGPNTSKGEGVVAFENVPVGKFSAEMWLSLDDTLRLRSIRYLFPGVPEDQLDQLTPMFDSLTQALTGVYGPSSPVIIPHFTVWKLPDTEVTLMVSPDWENDEMWHCTITYKLEIPIQNSGF